jgi:hypothetical protein
LAKALEVMMPVKAFQQVRSVEHHQLVDELYAEWTRPSPDAVEPVILEEAGRNKKLVHLYVIWSKWAHIDRIERSEIIIEAAEKKLPQNEWLEISIAMGLTPEEARQMGISG